MKNVWIADATLVQGMANFSFKESVEIARQLEKLRVSVIEIPKFVNTAKDVLLVKTIASFVKDSVISVDAGSTEDSIAVAAGSLQSAQQGRLRIVLPLSDVGMEYGYHKKGPAMVELVGQLVAAAVKQCADVEFCALDATRADEAVLHGAIRAAVDAGAKTVTLYDDEGILLPDEFKCFVDGAAQDVDDSVTIGVCCSNASDMAVASSLTALTGRCRLIKTSLQGESAPTEGVIRALRNCRYHSQFATAVDFTSAKRILSQMDWVIRRGKPSAEDAAAPAEQELLLDSNDDVTAIAAAVKTLGYDLSEEDMAKVFEEFKRIASKKTVSDREMEAIIASVALQVPDTYRLKHYSIHSVNTMAASAQLLLEKGEEQMQGIAIGDGPIDASFKTIEQITGHHFELDDFQIQSITRGHEAVGSALVKLRHNGKLYSGNGISTDIIGASIRAYINALNKIVYEED